MKLKPEQILNKRIKNAFKYRKYVAQGWFNDLIKNPKVEKRAKERLAVCRKCRFAKPDKLFGGYMCSKCLCPLEKLARSEKTCELNKWDV